MNMIIWRPGMKFRRINKGATNYGKTLTVDYVTSGGSMIWAKEDGCWSSPGGIEPVNEAPVNEAPTDFITPPADAKKTWIVCVINENNVPLPAKKPRTYDTRAQAIAVASEMAKRHDGQLFAVFEMVLAAITQPSVVYTSF